MNTQNIKVVHRSEYSQDVFELHINGEVVKTKQDLEQLDPKYEELLDVTTDEEESTDNDIKPYSVIKRWGNDDEIDDADKDYLNFIIDTIKDHCDKLGVEFVQIEENS